MTLRIIAIACAVFALGASGSALLFGQVDMSYAQTTPYSAPQTQEGDDGWLNYVDAPETGPDDAGSLNPAPGSAEAAVVKFLASRMRGDDAWEDALVTERSSRLERKIAEWDEWKIEGFQLRGRKPARGDGVYVKVFFRISIDGDSDSGTDEFEVVPEGDEWRIASIPS